MIITAGKYKGRKIEAPDEKITRPTLSKVRMSVFNTLQSMIDFEGCSFLDMFAGSGIMGLEALSRGFVRVVAIEKNQKSAKIIKENYNKIEGKKERRLEGKPSKNVINEILQYQQTDNSIPTYSPISLSSCVIIGDCLKILQKTDDRFDVIYIDPPYFSGIYEQCLEVVKNIASNVVILEHVVDVDFGEFKVVKQKRYGDKFVTFLKQE